MAKFKQDIIEKIKTNPDLFAAVAKAAGVNPGALHMALHRNGKSINQYAVVTVVADHLKLDAKDLMEEETAVQN